MVEKTIVPKQSINDLTVSDFRNALYVRFNQPLMIMALYGMLLSYFYNLSVFNYSAVGSNELRLYDFAGLILVVYYIYNFAYTYYFIKTQPFLRSLHFFLIYCIFSLMFTLFYSILYSKYLYFLSAVLYLYHFVIFFLTAVYLSILMRNPKRLKAFVVVSLIASSLAFLIVILQNLDIIPFLWNDDYKRMYQGFLSGTFGPNKIVVGMSAVMMSILSLALLNTKSITINRAIIYTALSTSLLAVVLSGSRTAYVGIAVFVVYFSIRQPLSIIYSSIGMLFFVAAVTVAQPELLDKMNQVYEQRVEKKISNEDDLKEANVGQLYEDLGAGRNFLLIRYIDLLAEEYYFIPFGKGFNNRIETASSAHNMYLSLIYEVGIVGMVLYFRWLSLYLFVRMRKLKVMETALHGLVISMMVTLFFGEHLYVYRALFGLLGLFLFVVTVLTSPIFVVGADAKESQ